MMREKGSQAFKRFGRLCEGMHGTYTLARAKHVRNMYLIERGSRYGSIGRRTGAPRNGRPWTAPQRTDGPRTDAEPAYQTEGAAPHPAEDPGKPRGDSLVLSARSKPTQT